MTKSAKQGTEKAPAEPAETESAATQGEAAKTGSTESAAGTGQDQAGSADQTATPDLDETKRKFREALERKHQVHSEGQGDGGRDGGKISGAHGPAASRRNFRRKSG
jgi:hypothetical protein